jgi:hypothetical protein
MSANSFNALVDGLTLSLGKGQVGQYKGRGATYRVNTAELLKDIEKVAGLIREKSDNLMTGKSKQAAANTKRIAEYPKLLDALIRMVPEEDMHRVEAIMAKVNGPKRGRTLVAAAVAAGGPGRSVSRGRSAPREAASAAAAPNTRKSKALSAWNEHVKAYAASHGIPYAQALSNSRNTYVPPEKPVKAAAAPRERSRSVSRHRSGAGAAAAANPFNNAKPKAKATRKAKAAPATPYNPFNNNAVYANAAAAAAAATNPFNQFNYSAAAAAPKNKTKRTRAKGDWNVLLAEVQAANPGMKRANVLKLASKQMGIRKGSPLMDYGNLGLSNNNAKAPAEPNFMSKYGL